jgi:hypothetical protein
MSETARALLALALCCAPLVPVKEASAQVPPHPPGTVCYTPHFWCWMSVPLKPGSPCACPTPYGLVPGTAG